LEVQLAVFHFFYTSKLWHDSEPSVIGFSTFFTFVVQNLFPRSHLIWFNQAL